MRAFERCHFLGGSHAAQAFTIGLRGNSYRLLIAPNRGAVYVMDVPACRKKLRITGQNTFTFHTTYVSWSADAKDATPEKNKSLSMIGEVGSIKVSTVAGKCVAVLGARKETFN